MGEAGIVTFNVGRLWSQYAETFRHAWGQYDSAAPLQPFKQFIRSVSPSSAQPRISGAVTRLQLSATTPINTSLGGNHARQSESQS
jgi:hypothetical protein